MKLTFLGTRGEIQARTRRHRLAQGFAEDGMDTWYVCRSILFGQSR
jgi:hypothetical protein